MSVAKGGMALIGAQAWHALTGWVIFRVATETLGDQGYGAFVSVLWTMTTLEVLVTEGAPRAMALGIALQPQATRATLRRAWPATFGFAVVLCGLLALAAPWLSASWRSPELSMAVRLSGLDFLTFAAFAVFASLANGLRDFAAQARVQVAYSTAKVLIVVAALLHFRSVEGAMLGYVVASGVGSLTAWIFTRHLADRMAASDGRPATLSAADYRHAWPLGLQSLFLAILINVDLWAGATIAGAEDLRFGLYSMAATLCHSVYFILRALGEALLPTIAHARGQQDEGAIRRATQDGLGLLLLLLAVAMGLGLAVSERAGTAACAT
jgi:O-antigen/teichoic acid export membrane protein